MRKGATAFIPGDCEHGVRNTGADSLQIFYAFAPDRFTEVAYRYS